MNEQTNKILSGLLQKASDGIDAAVSFSQAQIPDVVHQLLVWKFTISLIYFFIGLAIIPLWLLAYKKSSALATHLSGGRAERIKQQKADARAAYHAGKSWTRYGGSGTTTSIEFDRIMEQNPGILGRTLIHPLAFCVTGCFSLLMTICIVNFEWLKIWLAPKLYLLEYAASLVK
jgi:hypothetical protein